ncbi:MAG: type II secretion system protein [Phycisphaerae bacterium]
MLGRHTPMIIPGRQRRGFTLIELLVVIAIIGLLMGMLVPALSGARQRGIGAKCAAQLRGLGQGLTMYAFQHRDVLVPGRLPKVDNDNWYSDIKGGRKYRPTYLAMMGSNIGVQPFDDPAPSRNTIDRFGQRGDRQDYSNAFFVCPKTADWTDERNGSYGYNYQFLGNSRLLDAGDIHSFKNWPVIATRIRDPAGTIAVADCMGTAASYAPRERVIYDNNSRMLRRFGNEGFNLDPPRVDPGNGEMAGFTSSPQARSAADPRHLGRASTLFVDGHTESLTLEQMGYELLPDGTIGLDGNNTMWSGKRTDVAWTPGYEL